MSDHTLLQIIAYIGVAILIALGASITIRLRKLTHLKKTLNDIRGDLNTCRLELGRLKGAINRLGWGIARAFTIVDNWFGKLESGRLNIDVAVVELHALRDIVARLRSFLQMASGDAEHLAEGAERFIRDMNAQAPLDCVAETVPEHTQSLAGSRRASSSLPSS
jgi:hypothetical protein